MSTELIRQLEDRPLCAWCLAQGRITVAVAADYADRELESLCGDCFDRKTNPPAELGYVLDIGLDGYPLDSRHPTAPAETSRAIKIEP
jgi:5-methylcytosine-specific restriction enzyme A